MRILEYTKHPTTSMFEHCHHLWALLPTHHSAPKKQNSPGTKQVLGLINQNEYCKHNITYFCFGQSCVSRMPPSLKYSPARDATASSWPGSENKLWESVGYFCLTLCVVNWWGSKGCLNIFVDVNRTFWKRKNMRPKYVWFLNYELANSLIAAVL